MGLNKKQPNGKLVLSFNVVEDDTYCQELADGGRGISKRKPHDHVISFSVNRFENRQ